MSECTVCRVLAEEGLVLEGPPPLRRQTRHHHRPLIMLGAEIDPASASGIHNCTQEDIRHVW